jgi:hypothetical protein
MHYREKSYLEGFLSRGDERIGELLEKVWSKGARLEDHGRNFQFSRWKESIEELGLDEKNYLGEKDVEAKLPWHMVDMGIPDRFFINELEKARKAALTPDCREKCYGCGMKGRIKECGELVADKLNN